MRAFSIKRTAIPFLATALLATCCLLPRAHAQLGSGWIATNPTKHLRLSFDTKNGTEAFAQMLASVPEPTTQMFITVALISVLTNIRPKTKSH